MKVLIVKTSSMGDILHMLPAVEDAANAIADMHIDWLVEEGFREIPLWHSAVSRVIPVALRRWMRQPASWFNGEISAFLHQLRLETYDVILDTQGLLKSALWTLCALGKRHGFDRRSIREPLASFAYQHRWAVPKTQHAVTRLRALTAKALGYAQPESLPVYGINKDKLPTYTSDGPEVVFLHGTTWLTKQLALAHWIALGQRLEKKGISIVIPWGSSVEHARAQEIQSAVHSARVLPRSSLSEIAAVLLAAKGVVAVDTGFGHLAAALGVKAVSVYGPTDAKRTGTFGAHQLQAQSTMECSPCLKKRCPLAPSKSQSPCLAQPALLEQIWDPFIRQVESR